MGFPRWKRFCFLLLAAFTSSLLLYGHYYATVELRSGPRVVTSLLQPELLFLVRPDTPHPDNSHQQELRGTVKSREFFSQPSSELEKPKPSGKQVTISRRWSVPGAVPWATSLSPHRGAAPVSWGCPCAPSRCPG